MTARLLAGGLAALTLLAGCGTGRTENVAPRTLTVEVARHPSSTMSVNIVIVPLRSGAPAGDPIDLGTLRARDVARFEFTTDRLGAYRLYATSGRVQVIAGRVDVSFRGRDDQSSRVFYIAADTEQILWDLSTDRLVVR